MIRIIEIEEFVALSGQYPVLDVRSPGEYGHAHLPGAVSFPLFSDEERKVVGTLYKQEGRKAAIKAGLEFFGPKMAAMTRDAEQLCGAFDAGKDNPANSLLVHCWRGGMRSGGVGWLLDLYGFQVYTLKGGYKAYRKWAMQQFERSYSLKVLAGLTGTGKTSLLKQLSAHGAAVIDLEQLARHKGSVFGGYFEVQPGQEMFENELAMALYRNTKVNKADACIWVEDESQHIGKAFIPVSFWRQMQEAPAYLVQRSFEERLEQILREYGMLSSGVVKEAVRCIQKKLGGQNVKEINACVDNGDYRQAFSILLRYYDRLYEHGLSVRRQRGLLHQYSIDTVSN